MPLRREWSERRCVSTFIEKKTQHIYNTSNLLNTVKNMTSNSLRGLLRANLLRNLVKRMFICTHKPPINPATSPTAAMRKYSQNRTFIKTSAVVAELALSQSPVFKGSACDPNPFFHEIKKNQTIMTVVLALTHLHIKLIDQKLAPSSIAKRIPPIGERKAAATPAAVPKGNHLILGIMNKRKED